MSESPFVVLTLWDGHNVCIALFEIVAIEGMGGACKSRVHLRGGSTFDVLEKGTQVRRQMSKTITP